VTAIFSHFQASSRTIKIEVFDSWRYGTTLSHRFGAILLGGLLAGAWAAPAALAQTVPTTTAAAIQAAIQRANAEQQQAFALQDPTVMADTATPAYYDQMVQTEQDLAQSG
jgi:hypothetical protein